MRSLLLFLVGLAWMAVLPERSLAQNQTISGSVVDGAGRPLPGASVLVQNSNRGTATDAEGKFKIVVPAKSGIVVSATG
jgi:hypothetical protein